MLDQASEIGPLYHNAALLPISRVWPEFLLTRFSDVPGDEVGEVHSDSNGTEELTLYPDTTCKRARISSPPDS